jgi:hypothetical protein
MGYRKGGEWFVKQGDKTILMLKSRQKFSTFIYDETHFDFSPGHCHSLVWKQSRENPCFCIKI